jgi:DNA-binding NtrC family response regulator
VKLGYQTDFMKYSIIVLNPNKKESLCLCQILDELGYLSKPIISFDELVKSLSDETCHAAIIDIDTLKLDNRLIRQISEKYTKINLIFTSKDRLHPDLKESISQYVYACIHKPFDVDEIKLLFEKHIK